MLVGWPRRRRIRRLVRGDYFVGLVHLVLVYGAVRSNVIILFIRVLKVFILIFFELRGNFTWCCVRQLSTSALVVGRPEVVELVEADAEAYFGASRFLLLFEPIVDGHGRRAQPAVLLW